MTAMKSVENSWKRGIDKGKKTLTDVMNSIYQSRTIMSLQLTEQFQMLLKNCNTIILEV